jgi:hypothetical protein
MIPAQQVEAEAVAALAASAAPELRRLTVTATDAEVVITGRVPSYYFKQLAQEAVRPAAGGRRMVNRVEVEGNGTTPPPAAPPAPAPDDGVDRLQLSPEGWEMLADWKWVDQEYNAGRWEPYRGEYIAVVRKQLVGHGPDLLKLREDVSRETGIQPDRIVTAYVEPPIDC